MNPDNIDLYEKIKKYQDKIKSNLYFKLHIRCRLWRICANGSYTINMMVAIHVINSGCTV